jgi:diacylglycerol kinase (ATP)
MVRFYMHKKDNSSELAVPMFVGNLPAGLSQIQYEKILMDTLMRSASDASAKWSRFDVIYYEYGSMVMLYDDPEKAVRAYKILKDSSYENKPLMVLLLPTIQVARRLN